MVDETLTNEEGGALGQLRWGVPFLRWHRKAPRAGSVRYAGDEWRDYKQKQARNRRQSTQHRAIGCAKRSLRLRFSESPLWMFEEREVDFFTGVKASMDQIRAPKALDLAVSKW